MSDSKKMTKGTVAIAAGVVLLLGGAGTYALWEVTQPIDGDVVLGDLDLGLGEGQWDLNGMEVADPASVQIVPGDTLTLNQPLTVTAAGDNLEAQLSLGEGDGGFVPEEEEGLDQYLDVTLRLDTEWAAGQGTNAYLVPDTEEVHQVAAEVEIDFAESTPGQVGTDTTLDLTGLEFTLEQLPTGN